MVVNESTLMTERLLLRPFREEDYPALRAMDEDPLVSRYRSRPVIDQAMTRRFLERVLWAAEQKPQTSFPFAVMLRDSGQFIGQCGLTLIAAREGAAYLWYAANRSYWGQGYMTEAARAVLAYGFGELDLRRIEAGCHPDNLASLRVLHKIGMRPVEQAPPEGFSEWPLAARQRFAAEAGAWPISPDSE